MKHFRFCNFFVQYSWLSSLAPNRCDAKVKEDMLRLLSSWLDTELAFWLRDARQTSQTWLVRQTLSTCLVLIEIVLGKHMR